MWRTAGLGSYRKEQGMNSSSVLQRPDPSPGHQECHLTSTMEEVDGRTEGSSGSDHWDHLSLFRTASEAMFSLHDPHELI